MTPARRRTTGFPSPALRDSVEVVRRLALVPVVLGLVGAAPPAHADDQASPKAAGAHVPPMAPFRRGALVEGSVGTYAPLGSLGRVSAPAPLFRLSAGWDFSRWFATFASADAAFLDTGRAPPPPGARGYVLYGFGVGLRASVPAGERWRFPVRLDLGAHKASDNGVLRTYGFLSATELGISYGATAGIEWRALSRHFGVLVEGGVRADSAVRKASDPGAPLAIIAAASLHYTL